MAAAVGVMVTALYLYRGAMVVVKVAQEAYAVAQALMEGVQLASIASTSGLAASTLALNAALRAIPVGLVVTAVMLLVGGFVLLWDKSEAFRKSHSSSQESRSQRLDQSSRLLAKWQRQSSSSSSLL
jgi:phage-related tail protein